MSELPPMDEPPLSSGRPPTRLGSRLLSVWPLNWLTRNMETTFRSLRHPNYRLFFMGFGVSQVGTWVQKIAMGWLVYHMTRDPFMLGLVAFCSQIFQLFVPPLAGVMADRVNRRTMVIVTQSLATVHALVLAVLALTGVIQVWHIVTLSLFMGLVGSFDVTARQSLVSDLVGFKEDLGNAIALNSSLFNIARIIGPTIGAAMIAGGAGLARLAGLSERVPYAGEGTCFLINAISFGAVIFALFRMEMPPRTARRRPNVLGDMREGILYVLGHPGIGTILLLMAVVSVLALPFIEFMPLFARQISPDSNPHVLGYLLSAHGVGALVGAILLASRRRTEGLWRMMAMAIALIGVSIMLFAYCRWLEANVALMMLVGFGLITRGASANTLVQTLAEDDKRGRVLSLYIMAQHGLAPFGNLLQGYLARKFGASIVVLIAGGLCVLTAVWFTSRLPMIRRHLASRRKPCPALASLELEQAGAPGR